MVLGPLGDGNKMTVTWHISQEECLPRDAGAQFSPGDGRCSSHIRSSRLGSFANKWCRASHSGSLPKGLSELAESPNMALLASSTMEHNNCRSHQPVEASFPKSMRITREIEKNPQTSLVLGFSPQNRAWISQIPHQLLDSFGFLQTSISTWICQWMGIIFSNSTSRRSDCQVMSSWR